MDSQLNLNRICDLLKYHYPMPIDSIEPAPRGFAAETYYINSGKNSYFLKIMYRPNRHDLFKNGLRQVAALTEAGIDFIPAIIPARQGQLYIEEIYEQGKAILVVFERIEAKQSYDYDRRDAFEKLATIYKTSLTLKNKDSFYKEGFHDGFIDTYSQVLKDFWALEEKGLYREAKLARELLGPYTDSLEACPQEARQAVIGARSQRSTFYLTHSDYPNNIMVDKNGKQYIIDFDESLYGPLERDGWMTIVKENEESRIWDQVMRHHFEDYSINHYYIRFFVYDRFMIDLRDFLKDLSGNPDEAYRKKVLVSLKDYLLDQLYPVLLRYRQMDL